MNEASVFQYRIEHFSFFDVSMNWILWTQWKIAIIIHKNNGKNQIPDKRWNNWRISAFRPPPGHFAFFLCFPSFTYQLSYVSIRKPRCIDSAGLGNIRQSTSSITFQLDICLPFRYIRKFIGRKRGSREIMQNGREGSSGNAEWNAKNFGGNGGLTKIVIS